MHISESKRCYNVLPLVHYFYVKTKILADFQIFISVPLSPPSFNFGCSRSYGKGDVMVPIPILIFTNDILN